MTDQKHKCSRVDKYVHHRNLFVRGQIETSIPMGLLQSGVVYGLYLRVVLNVSVENTSLLVFLAVLVLGWLQYRVGYFYDKWKIFHADKEWETRRWPTMEEILKNVSEKKKPAVKNYFRGNPEVRDHRDIGKPFNQEGE